MQLRRKLKALALERSKLPSISAREYSEVPAPFSAAIVDIVSGLLPVKNFPVQPGDELWSFFDLEQGSLESEIEDFLQRVAPSAPPLADSEFIRDPQTVRELVAMTYAHAKPYLAVG